jgi:enamine deaminase RidA (YjgF/YER057c/UK114 family)/ketosteroid isomerase-like protein
MTTANARTLEQANAAIAVGDHEGFLAHCTDDTVWHFVGERTLRGKEAVRRYLNATYLEPPRVTVVQLIAEGDFVTAIGDIAITDAAGRVTHSAYCDVWRLREGKLAELRAFVVEINAENGSEHGRGSSGRGAVLAGSALPRPTPGESRPALRDAVFPADPHALYAQHRYSPAVRAGDLLFVSGQVGSRRDGSPEPDFTRQVRLAFDNLAAVLAAAGCTFDDVVDVTTFHTDPGAQLETVRAVRAQMIGEPPYPAWTAVGVNWLAGFDFEIKVVAQRRLGA